uniref:Putative interferon-related developmental regulator n=1 Tax=Ornithodoros turicata TaxID=34597 RepID=A0A2R5LNS2_9ACAR
MPKGKRRSKAGGAARSRPDASATNHNGAASSDDESIPDTGSVASCGISCDSRCGSDAGTVGDPDAEDTIQHDDFEDKLKEAIDGTSQKSAKGRLACLEAVRKALSARYLYDFLADRPTTVSDMVERGVHRGRGGEEVGLSATVGALLCVHFGAGDDSQALFAALRQPLLSALADPAQSPHTRAKCATSLGLCCFIAESDNFVVVQSAMEALQSVLTSSSRKTMEGQAVLQSAALLAWGLLLTVASVDRVLAVAPSQLKKLQEVLQSSDLDLRIAAGEVIAIIYEVAREYDEDFEDPSEELLEQLRQLATDSQKFRAKKDRRQQRSTFRDVYRAVKENGSPDITVKFGREVLELDTWCRKLQYDAFCQVIGAGINFHLAENELLRDVFELGPPLTQEDAIISKVTKFERHMVNVASCRARTKTRNRLRDKRADILA